MHVHTYVGAYLFRTEYWMLYILRSRWISFRLFSHRFTACNMYACMHINAEYSERNWYLTRAMKILCKIYDNVYADVKIFLLMRLYAVKGFNNFAGRIVISRLKKKFL